MARAKLADGAARRANGGRLGLILGDREIARRVAAKFPDAVIVGVKGSYTGAADLLVPLAGLGRAVKFMKKRGVGRVAMAGGVHGAKLGFSWLLLKFVFLLIFRRNRFDGVLRLVAHEFEKKGIAVASLLDLVPEMAAGKGVLGRVRPGAEDMAGIAAGWEHAREFARSDRGQALAVRGGRVVATERWAGTDELVKRAGKIARGCVLIKLMKPEQDARLDIPVIGPYTIKTLAAAGFKGVAVEAGRTIIDDARATTAAADKAGIFIVGI